MRFDDDAETVLRVNEHVSLRGIPASAHTYQANRRTPLGPAQHRGFLRSDPALVHQVRFAS